MNVDNCEYLVWQGAKLLLIPRLLSASEQHIIQHTCLLSVGKVLPVLAANVHRSDAGHHTMQAEAAKRQQQLQARVAGSMAWKEEQQQGAQALEAQRQQRQRQQHQQVNPFFTCKPPCPSTDQEELLCSISAVLVSLCISEVRS